MRYIKLAAMKTETVVVFDLDGTLTKRDTFLPFLFGYLIRKPSRILHVGALAWSILLFKTGRITNETLKQHFLAAFLKGAKLQEVKDWAHRYVKFVARRGLREKVIRQLEEHRAKGHILCILSASFDLYVPILANELGVENVICTEAEFSAENRLTGQLATPNCYGNEKVRRLEEWLRSFNVRPRVVAYGDQLSDIPVLEKADQGVLIGRDEVKSLIDYGYLKRRN